MIITGTPVFQARRIEAGLLNAGSDFGSDTTPFDAGLGAFVEFGHRDFVGRAALEVASQECRTQGMRVMGGVARLGRVIARQAILLAKSDPRAIPLIKCVVCASCGCTIRSTVPAPKYASKERMAHR